MTIFAYSKWDIVPVLAAMAHLAFNIDLIAGFESRPLWLSAALGSLYALSISWNINSISHNFIHTPYFRSRWMNRLFSLLESVTIGFSQTYYHFVHMRRLDGITHKALAEALKRLERNGLIRREVLTTTTPVGVEYTITSLGRSLQQPFEALYTWSMTYGPELEQAQHDYDNGKR